MARILFIDDDPLTLETLTKAVEVFGHHAILATNGKEGLALAAQQSPDLIFTDMGLHDLRGLELVKKLKARRATANIPVFILSASPELDALELTKAAGAEDYLNKPIRLQDLLGIIEKYAPK